MTGEGNKGKQRAIAKASYRRGCYDMSVREFTKVIMLDLLLYKFALVQCPV